MPCPNSQTLRRPASPANDALQDGIECFDSLNRAIEQAGGGHWTVAGLQSLSAFELLALIAPNNIRFRYEGP